MSSLAEAAGRNLPPVFPLDTPQGNGRDVLREKSAEPELVKHPRHYNVHPAGIECITVIEHMTFNIGTAIKHLWRAGLKPDNDTLTDLRKAITYLEFEIERLERDHE
jgi:hypothetical protein